MIPLKQNILSSYVHKMFSSVAKNHANNLFSFSNSKACSINNIMIILVLYFLNFKNLNSFKSLKIFEGEMVIEKPSPQLSLKYFVNLC